MQRKYDPALLQHLPLFAFLTPLGPETLLEYTDNVISQPQRVPLPLWRRFANAHSFTPALCNLVHVLLLLPVSLD